MSSSVKNGSRIILVFPFDLMSHYLRCIKLCENYREYRVIFLYSKKYSKYLIENGFEYFEGEHFNADRVINESKMFKFQWLNEKDIATVVQSQIDSIKKYKPEFVIGDSAPTLKMVCELTNTRYVSLMNGYMSKHYALNRSLPRKFIITKFVKLLPQKFQTVLTRFGENVMFYYIHKPFKITRRKLGLSYVKNYLDELEGDHNLICDSEYMFPQKKMPETYQIIGPLLYDNSEAKTDLIQLINNGKMNICVSFGSTGDWQPLSFLSDPTYSKFNIITTGDSEGIIKGEHVISKDFVNLDRLLPFCKLLICHGGNGTIYQGIKHQVQILCLPVHFEQYWNADRIESFGFGQNISQNPKKSIDYWLHRIK